MRWKKRQLRSVYQGASTKVQVPGMQEIVLLMKSLDKFGKEAILYAGK